MESLKVKKGKGKGKQPVRQDTTGSAKEQLEEMTLEANQAQEIYRNISKKPSIYKIWTNSGYRTSIIRRNWIGLQKDNKSESSSNKSCND